MVHNVQYNGLTFLNSPYFRPEWGFLCLKEFSFFEVATSASTEKYAIRHWEYVSPTLKKNRRIRMLFDILADNEQDRWTRLKKVQRAFSPEQNPSPFNENLWKTLTFSDVNWDTWTCKCQVIQWIQLSDFWNEKWVGISVELITNSAEFRSSEVQSIETWRNTRFWKRLWSNLEFVYEYYRDIVNYQWVIDSPLTITLTITENNSCPNKKINISHEREGTHEGLQIADVDGLDLQIGDKITIDTDNRRVYLYQGENETDLTWLVTLWSQRPMLKLWENIIAVDTGATEKTMDVDIEWTDVF